MWLIWLGMAILLVVVAVGGYGGRRAYARQKETQGHVNPHQGHHQDRKAKSSRGRGKSH
jgi:hypothetical protein